MSLHRLSGGAGYQYLLRHTACGDADRAISDGLVDYYARTGYPPGQWLGGGLAGLSMDSPSPIGPGDVVSEDQLALLFGAGRHPITGQQLGQTPRTDASRRVSGFDLTFTVPKSASVLGAWATSSPGKPWPTLTARQWPTCWGGSRIGRCSPGPGATGSTRSPPAGCSPRSSTTGTPATETRTCTHM